MKKDNNSIVVGLDIGTTKIAAVVGIQNDDGKIEILGFGHAKSVGVRRGVVSNIVKTVESIQLAVKDAEDAANVSIFDVNVGIAGQHIRSMQQRGSLIRSNSDTVIEQEEIDKIIDDMYNIPVKVGEEVINVIPQEYIIDDEPGNTMPVGMFGKKIEADCHVITAQTTATNNIKLCVDNANLNTDDIILEPIASAEAVLSLEEKEAGVVIVDIGGGTTDVAIFIRGVIRHTAVIPFGGEIITEDIKKGCMIVKNHAEKIKVEFGSCLSKDNQTLNDNSVISIKGVRNQPDKEISISTLSSIIDARMTEIMSLVKMEIQNNVDISELISGIVLTGGGSQLAHLTQLTSFITGLNCRIGNPVEHLNSTSHPDLSNPAYATGIGLVASSFIDNNDEYYSNINYKNHNAFGKGNKRKGVKPKSNRSGIKNFFRNDGRFTDKGIY